MCPDDRINELRRLRDLKQISDDEYVAGIRMAVVSHRVSSVTSFRMLVSTFLTLIATVFSFVGFVVAVKGVHSGSGETDQEDSELIVKNVREIIGKDGVVVGSNPDYLPLDLDYEERFQNQRIKGVDILLGDIALSEDLLCEKFEKLETNSGRYLRFRIMLKDGRYTDAVIIPGCEYILHASAPKKIGVPVNRIACFRSMIKSGGEFGSSTEYLTDNEARILFHRVCFIASHTDYDWNSIFSHIPFGIWNRYHPVRSGMVLLLIGLGYFAYRFVRELIEKRIARQKETKNIEDRKQSA